MTGTITIRGLSDREIREMTPDAKEYNFGYSLSINCQCRASEKPRIVAELARALKLDAVGKLALLSLLMGDEQKLPWENNNARVEVDLSKRRREQT